MARNKKFFRTSHFIILFPLLLYSEEGRAFVVTTCVSFNRYSCGQLPINFETKSHHGSAVHLSASSGNTGAGQDNSMPASVQETVSYLDKSELPLWALIQFEASLMARTDQKAASMLYESVLAHDSFPDALAHNIANRIQTDFLSAVQIQEFILEMFQEQPSMRGIVASDILASAMRDPSVPNVLTAFLFSKGLHAVFTFRIANYLWKLGRKDLALYVQSRNSQVFHADIHPAATIERGLYLHSGTTVVIGETAVIGKNCCISQQVTLGGTGKVRGDRHPKLQAGVTVGVGAAILGNIVIGEGAVITSKSVVVKPVPPFTRSSGVPSKVVSKISCAVELAADAFPEANVYVSNLSRDIGI